MLKITIDGESKRKKVTFNNYKQANIEFMTRLSESYKLNGGYNKTWINIEYNSKPILKLRLDLNSKITALTLKTALQKHIEGSINFYESYINKLDYIKQENITEAKNALTFINCIDTKQNKINTKKHLYEFYCKGEKVHEYDSFTPIPNKQIETTLKILAGVEKGFGSPITDNIQDLRCINKVIQLQF